jgi:hypothetical protein
LVLTGVMVPLCLRGAGAYLACSYGPHGGGRLA